MVWEKIEKFKLITTIKSPISLYVLVLLLFTEFLQFPGYRLMAFILIIITLVVVTIIILFRPKNLLYDADKHFIIEKGGMEYERIKLEGQIQILMKKLEK